MTENAVDKGKRTWLLTTGCLGAAGVAALAVPLLGSLVPTQANRQTGDTLEVDIADIPAGEKRVVAWRGKPVWILRRTPDMVARLGHGDAALVDPDSQRTSVPTPLFAQNAWRARTRDVFVCVGFCTHLGCSPTDQFTPGAQPGLPADWPGGFVCPCHHSLFDLAGRVFKGGAASDNMEIPPYVFLSPTRLLIGPTSHG